MKTPAVVVTCGLLCELSCGLLPKTLPARHSYKSSQHVRKLHKSMPSSDRIRSKLYDSDCSRPLSDLRAINATTNGIHVGADDISYRSLPMEGVDGATSASLTSLDRNLSSHSSSMLSQEAVLLLNLVAVLWGSQHAIIKSVVQDTDAGAFTFLRFGLAALLAAPYTPGLSSTRTMQDSTAKNSVGHTWRWGAEMGLWMFLGFSFQAIGLEYTTAQKSGFLLYLNVKFVPFFASFLLGRKITGATWVSAFTAFSGTALLAFGSGDGSFNFNVGDAWSIAAAAASAMFILRLERASAQVADSAALNAACLWIVTLLAGIWSFAGFAIQGDPSTALVEVVAIAKQHPLEMVYLSGVTTAFANWIQTKAQRSVSAERASIIYAMDPVYGAAFSSWLLGESLGGPAGWVGASLIVLAAATNAFLDFAKDQNSSDPTV